MEPHESGRPACDVMTIGQFARATGLSVSALRFYDAAGVLPPDEVDAATGYRLYRSRQLDTGRLTARLRRIGLGTREIRQVVAGDPVTVDAVLGDHLRRLEAGLADARSELTRIRGQLTEVRRQESGLGVEQRFEVWGRDLARAIAATRFAVAADDPEVTAYFFDLADDQLTIFTTDRFRMAASSVPAPVVAGTSVGQLTLSVQAAETLASVVAGQGAVTVSLTAAGLSVSTGDGVTIMVPVMTDAVPDHRVIMAAPDDGLALTADAAQLLTELRRAPSTVFLGGDNGRLVLASERRTDGVPVDRDYLRSAIEADGEGALTLTLHGARPLAVVFDDTPETAVVIMPLRV